MCRPCPADGCTCNICLDWPGHALDVDGNVIEVDT